jgi:hypothetical protein
VGQLVGLLVLCFGKRSRRPPRAPRGRDVLHCYVAFPQFEVAEDDEDQGALRCAARTSSGRDLVEEFIGYGVWPLAHGWVLGEVCPRQMPTLGQQLVRSPAFSLDLRGQDPAGFIREVEDRTVRIVGWYAPMTESLRSWDIRGSNVRLNRVFEFNRLPYGGYPGDDAAAAIDHRGKKPVVVAEEGPSWEASPATKKRKIGTTMGGLGVSDRFAVELMGTCAALGGRISSPELRESSARMLKVTGGQWPRNIPIPRAAGEDIFTSRMACELKIFPYGWNIAAVVSAVMEKDRQDAARKRWAITRVGDPLREVKRARGGAKSTAPGSSKPPLAAKPVVPEPSKSLAGPRAAAFGTGKPPSAEPAKERRPPSPVRTVEAVTGGADFDTDIYVDDYLIGEFFLIAMMDKVMVQGRMWGSWLLSRVRWRPLRLRWRVERRVLRRTHGPNSTPAARFCRPLPLGMWGALCPSS